MTGKELLEKYNKRRQGNNSSSEETTKTNSSSLSGSELLERYRKSRGLVTSTEEETASSTESAWDKYKEFANSEEASSGWEKYLADTEASKQAEKTVLKHDLNEDGKEAWWEKALGWLSESGNSADTTLPMANTTQVINDLRTTGLPDYTTPEDDWNDEQRNIFGYLYSNSPTQASKYAKYLNTEAKEKEAIQKIQDSATSNFWAGAGHTAGAIATAPLGLADFLNDLVLAQAGVSNTQYDGTVSPFEYSQAVTGGISENLNENYGTIDESVPIIGGKGWGDVYGLGTSIAQSAVSGYTMGGIGTLVSYFGQGAASGVDDALSRGASEEQALTYGALVGLAEGIAESIGIEKLFKIGASPTKKVLIKNILKQAGAEGLEEGFTSIMSNAIDNAIMGVWAGDKSNFDAMVKAYMEQGMTEAKAKNKAWMDSIEGILFDALGGAISGGVHGGVQTGIQTIINNNKVSQKYGDNQSIQDLLIDAVNTGGEAATLADKYTAKYGKKGKLSGADLTELLWTTDTTKMRMDIEAKLTEHGETGDVSAIADVLIKQAVGEELTSKDVNTLNNSKAGHLVSAQMNRKNIESGALHDDWATYIGTEMIHPEAYNRGVHDFNKFVKGYKENAQKASVAKELGESGGASEAKIEVSDNGKNMYYDAETNSYLDADIKSVVSTKGGIKVELENGKTVKASDLRFASREEGVVYEMLARMDVTPETANEIINTFKPSNANQAELYYDSIPLAYRMGLMNNEKGLKFVKLSDAQKRLVYNRGRIDAVTNAKNRDNARAISSTKAEASKTGKNGIIYEGDFAYDESSANSLQKAGMAGAEAIAKTTNLEVHVFKSFMKDGERVAYVNGKLTSAPNGYFTGGNKIYIDINAGMNAEGAMLYALSHEVTHYIRKWNAQGFKDLADFLIAEYGKHGVDITALIQRQKDKIKKRHIAEETARIKKQYETEGKAIPTEAELEKMASETLPNDAKMFDMAYEELVADAMSDMFADPNAYKKLEKLKKKNFKAWKKLGEVIKQVLDKLKNALGLYRNNSPVAPEAFNVRGFSKEVYEKLQDLYIKAFVEADANYEAAGGEITDLDGNESEHLFSDKSMIEGAGLQFILNEDGVNYKVLDKNGKPVKSVTAEMIVNSPLGNLVTMAKNEGFLGKGKEATTAAKKQYEFLADLVNMCINYNGIAPIWETAGTLVFSSMKSNADKQYGLTIDFSTVCKKTQAIVDAMSEAMLRLGRGLTRSEVETIYLEVGKAGESTPCPVCYVFSRWMGIGGILDQISRFQDKYTDMSEKSLQKFIADIQERIEEAANTPDKNGNLKPKFFTGKGAISEGQVIADLKSKASSKAASALKAIANNSNIQLEIQELEKMMAAQDSKEAKKTAAKIKKKKDKLTDVSALEKEMRDANDTLEEYEAYQWLTRTLMMESDDKWIKNSAFKPVPKDILFDLNKGDKFAEGYPLSWAFRTGKGASAGKAIVPYADARVGEAIQSVANQSPKDIKIGLELNPFLNSDTAGRLKILKSAIAKQARQNLLGGQRYQSTSDFRYEYGSDYLITFLEMQAIGAKVQLYTKVIEAVDFLASMGADCNLSVMPLSDGFITLPDGTKKLVYSSVTGINAEAAIKKSQEYNNVQLILVGISDEHIRLALEGTDVTFVIPFHGSGNSVHQIQALMNLIGENLDVTTAQDYTSVQSDHVSPKQTKEQKAMWNLRAKIVKGEAFPITVAEQALLDKNSYLKDLYRRFYLDKTADEYGVGLTSDQSKQIFPYEYWDKSLTYAEADKNGERFKEYCASMGIIPRFSGMNSKGEYVGFGDFTNDKGYWKLLIDRPMYDNTYDSEGNWTGYGKYHEQARINCSNFNVKHLDPEYGSATYGEVMSKENDPKKTNKIVDAALKQFENNTLNDVRLSDRDSIINDTVSNIESDQRDFDQNEVIEHTTDVVNSIRFSDRDDVSNTENTYMKIGKEMMAYAEGDRKPDLTLVEVYNERTGKTETTVKFVGDKPKDYIPRKIAYCYKLFEQHPDGTLHALFAGASNATPVGEWVYSKGFPYTDSGVKGMNLRERYGWHLSAGLPSAPHLMSSKEFERGYPSKNAYGHPKGSKRVWVRMAYDATTDFNSIADSTKAGDIFGLIPFGGYYAFKENNQSEWVISSAVKIDKILKEEERQQILKEAGYDEYEAWRKKHRATEAEKAESKRKSAENKKAKDNAKKSGLNYLSESAKEMREAINSRIIDNPELSDISYSNREIQPITETEYETLKKHFGVTANFRVAGYLLPDGKLLDFSGKHWGDTTSRSRQVDHRDAEEVLERGNNGINSMVDMIGSGSIRLMPETGGINLAVYPNEKQRRVLSVYIKQMLATEGQVIIDYDSVGGDTVHSRVYEKYASSAQILSDIRNYFNGARQSELMSFHTMYSDRDTDSVSNRTLLANALESVAQNDIEKTKLTQYKEKIALIESEQKKLEETRAKIKELSFAKGARDTEAIKKLQFDANQMANRINTYDKQLLSLESTKALKGVLEREKKVLRKRLEQQGKEALNAQKAKNAETVREIMTRNTESRKKAVEGRHKTELRGDIKKLLQRIRKVFNGGKERNNVKEGMRETVATALALGDVLFSNEISNIDIVNLGVESVTEKESKFLNEYSDILMKKESNLDRIGTLRSTLDVDNKEQTYAYISELEAQNRKYDRRISDLNGLLSDVFVRERARLNRMPITTLINELASEYQKLQTSKDNYIKASYEPALYERLVALNEKLGGVVARDMSIYQLEKVKEVFKMIEHTIQTANKEFRNGKWEDLQQRASAVMEEIEKLKDVKPQSSLVLYKMREYLWNELTPYYAFDKIGSETLMEYFWDLIKGQSVAARDFDEANEFASATREKYGYSKWKLDEMYDFKLRDGRTFSTTLKHLLSVYAYSKREQADLHMSIGGFFHNDKATFRKEKGILKMVRTDAVGYKVDDVVLAEIKAALGNEKMSYVDEMLDYLTKMGEKGNEVTRVLWGIDIFKEKVYFPLKSKDDFLKKTNETATAVSLKNDGMTKETVPGASNPIVLEAFDDVWTDHVERMSTYHGLVIPIDNLNKVLHYGTWVGTDTMSVSTMLEGKFTSAATDYLEQWINDLNGGAIAKGATNPFMSFFSKFKKTVVGASLSTVVQQPTAVTRAMAEIDAKYFVGKPNLTKLNEQWEEFRKYAPIAIIKEIGGFDAGGGKSASRWINSNTLTGVDKVMNTVDDISMKGAEIADKIGWLTIWNAVKREVADTTNLKVDSQEFLDKCGERATEVIVKTQVYDSTLSRSGFMRSKNDGVKMITSFAGEPTLSLNMMYSAVINALRGGKEAKIKAAKTIGFVYLSIVLAEALASAVYALRDDDEDETYMEKYLQSFGGSVVSDIVLAPVTSLPGVKDVVSIFQGWDVERSDMTIFKDIKDAFDGLDSESKSPYRKVEDFAGAIAAAFGLPLKNVLRTGREVYNAGSHIFDGASGGSAWDAFAEGITGNSTSNSDSLYKAMVSGNQNQINRIKGRYANEQAFESAQRQALRDNDSRIKEAAQARYEGDISEYTRIAKEIIREGNFSQDSVVGAINAELNAIKRGETTEEVATEDKDEVTSIYSGSDVNSAFDNGDYALGKQIISELIETKVANGMEEKNAKTSLRSSMTSYWKPLYKEAYQSGDTNEMARIRQILYSSGLYGSANEVVKTTQSWLKG